MIIRTFLLESLVALWTYHRVSDWSDRHFIYWQHTLSAWVDTRKATYKQIMTQLECNKEFSYQSHDGAGFDLLKIYQSQVNQNIPVSWC